MERIENESAGNSRSFSGRTDEDQRMISEHILKELDIEDGESFVYFEQFSALMESAEEIDYDTFAELIQMAEPEDLTEMISSFFEDIIRGVPDDNTILYSALEARRTLFEALSKHAGDRGAGLFADELYSFREWFLEEETVLCIPEDGNGRRQSLSPCQALMLYREEKLSGIRYEYDYSQAPLREIDQYTLALLAEMEADDLQEFLYGDDDLDYLPDELPADFDFSDYIPGQTDLSDYISDLDPYRYGLIDRDNPVIDGEDYEQY